MQIMGEVFEKHLPKVLSWEDEAFSFCEFRGIQGEGLHTTSIFLGCTFDQCDFYWALFNIATFIGVKFQNCDFRGCSFPGSRFIECVFENCRFIADNLGGECSFNDSRWYGCRQQGSLGLNIDFASA